VKKIEAIIRPHRLEEVKDALRDMGVAGMTVCQVRGFGRTDGQVEIYRGVAHRVDFVQKVRIEIMVEDAMASDVIGCIMTTAKTGKTGAIGDGKIFVASIDEAVRIRTGERGKDAL
jgi:nitrogen regulatory protein P-II 1